MRISDRGHIGMAKAKRAWRVTGITPEFRNFRVGTLWR